MNEVKQAAKIFAEIGELSYQHLPAGQIESDVEEEYEYRLITGEDVSKSEIYDERKEDSCELAMEIFQKVLTLFEILDITETKEKY